MADKVKLGGMIEPAGFDLNGNPLFNTYVTVNGRQMAWDSAEFKKKVLSKFIGDVQITLEEQPLIPVLSKRASSGISILTKACATIGTIAAAGGILWERMLTSNAEGVTNLQTLADLSRLENYANLLWQAGLILALVSLLVIVIRK